MPEAESTGERASHLSIGEVLALLLEEFPDVTISKIRFLESQGLINPERTPSGYRKFYEDDIDLLRVILREQRENFLPLKVIKDRLDSGEIDPTSEQTRPKGIVNVPDAPPAPSIDQARQDHPSGGPPPAPPPAPTPEAPATDPTGPIERTPGDRFSFEELCESAGLTVKQAQELESFGLFAKDGPDYGTDAIEIAAHCQTMLEAGIDARHLKTWRVSAEREAGLYEQLIQPLLRQRNPDANRQALSDLGRLEYSGGQLRAAIVRASLRHHAGH